MSNCEQFESVFHKEFIVVVMNLESDSDFYNVIKKNMF